MFLVYIITCERNGKHYIGCTTKRLHERWAGHVADALRCRKLSALHDAIRVYGSESFTCDVIYEAASKAEMFVVERGLIAMHGTLAPRGYNLAQGGLGGDIGIGGRAKISQARKRRMADPEWIAKYWTPEIQAARVASMRQASYTPEWRAKVSAKAVERWARPGQRENRAEWARSRKRTTQGTFASEEK